MEREITLSSFSVKNVSGNRPGDFTTRFTPTIRLDNDATYYIGFNRIDHFTVVSLVTWPLNGSEAGVDLVLIQTLLLLLCKSSCSYAK